MTLPKSITCAALPITTLLHGQAEHGEESCDKDAGAVVLSKVNGSAVGGGWSSRGLGASGLAGSGLFTAGRGGGWGGAGRSRRAVAALGLGGVLCAASDRLASSLSVAVVGVVQDAVGPPLLANEEGQGLGVVGDVAGLAIGAGAVVCQLFLVHSQRVGLGRAHSDRLTASHVLVSARPPQICGQAMVCPRHHEALSEEGISLAVMLRLPDVE